jgi:hypothetical protein
MCSENRALGRCQSLDLLVDGAFTRGPRRRGRSISYPRALTYLLDRRNTASPEKERVVKVGTTLLA